MVVLLAKPVECTLLGREGRARRSNRPALQRLVHALVGAVLLWVRGQDALVLNAQAEPPHVERREPMQRGGRERHAVVGPHRPRQPIFAEEAIEDGPHARAFRRQQPVARQ